MVTRSEGYERSRGKEDPAIAVVLDCVEAVLGLQAKVITEETRNRRHGDIELVGTAECKGQPIDPDHYDRNFVEVFEDTSAMAQARHARGFTRTAQILSLNVSQLAGATYMDHRDPARPRRSVGMLSHVSASMESILGSDMTIYANADPQRTFVYFYTRPFLLAAVRKQVLDGGLRRGMGRSNEDTFGVLVPNSKARWRRTADGWRFCGEGDPPIERIRAAMNRVSSTA